MVATIGLAALLTSFEVGDTYCGTALYDTSAAAQCSASVSARRAVAALCAMILIGSLATGASAARAGRRFSRFVAVVLFAISVASVLVMLNRLLQPTRTEWCGSVVNRHHTYEPVIETRCDRLLDPFLKAAIGAGTVALASLWCGISLWRRKFPPHATM